jgi:hypothetical protein
MADKKKETKKKAQPRLKKTARVRTAKRKVAKKRLRSRAEWFAARLKEEQRELWRFTLVASCIRGDAKKAIAAADEAAKAFEKRFRDEQVLGGFVLRD